MAAVASRPDLLELTRHAPRRFNLDSSTLLAARGGGNMRPSTSRMASEGTREVVTPP